MRRWTGIAGLACVTGWAPAAAGMPDASLRVGSAGWSLETFDPDVVVLHTAATRAGGNDLGVFLSCSGTERRLRLTFPSPIGNVRPPATAGVLALRKREPGGRRRTVVVPVRIVDGTVVTTAERNAGRAVREFADMLRAPAQSLELLLGLGRPPYALARMMPYALSLSAGPGSSDVFGPFASACERGAAARPR